MRRVAGHAYSTTPSIASTPGGDERYHDLLAYLGSINTGFVSLAELRLYFLLRGSLALGSEETDLDVLALTVLGIANASQAFLNLVLYRATDDWVVRKGF